MNGYELGKIYKLECNGLVYYGSTIHTLEKRLKDHRANYKYFLKGEGGYYSSFEIIKLEDYKMELVEDYPCSSKKELEIRESHFITNFECVNKCIARRTKREYYEANKAKILEKRKEYVKKNYDKILENKKAYHKEFYDEHKAEILQQKKLYYEANKELLKQKARERYQAKKIKDIN